MWAPTTGAASISATQQGQAVGQIVEIEGTLDVRIEDHTTGEIIRYSIDTGNGRWDVRIPPGQLKNLLSGSRVRARGHVQGQNVLDLSTDGSLAPLAPAAANTFGDQRTVVILVNFTDNLGSPVTASDAAAVTFGQVNSFYQENSYGQTSVSGDVYGLYTIPMSSTVCDSNQLATLADQQATNHGVNLSLYTRKVYSFPNNACTWWGLGTVGGQPSQAWINGTYSLKVVGHEMGHNFGDYHSKSSPCDPAGGCSMVEYGDDRDIMGQSGIGHLNAFQKERLGWLNYGSSPGIQTVTGPGTYWIDSLQTLGGTKALKILQSSTSGNTYYYVEARTQTGFDAGYGPGVILHTGNDTDGNTSVQVDLDPQTTAFDSVLDPGQSFVDSSIALTITTSSMEAGGAWVNVQMPQGPPCTYTISPTSSGTLSSSGSTSSFSVTTGAGCTWSASSPQSWIHTTSTGAGNGTVSYFIDANNGGSRTGSISVGGKSYTVSQAAAPCSYSLNPTSSGTLSGSGASGSTQMTTGSNCSWTTTASKTWIHPISGGTGSGPITYTIDANTGVARSGNIKAGGQTYTINQAAQVVGCTYSLSPTSSGTLSASGTSGSFGVTTSAGCTWAAATGDAWIHTSSSGGGNGTVTFTIDANTGAARSGSISVGGQTFAVSQAAAACTYSISPASSGLLNSAAGGGSFAVTAGSWCSWSATTGDAWIHASSSGTGAGTVTFTVDANAGAARNGSISVGGQTFAVSQAAAACTYSVSPSSSGTLSASGTSGSFGVTAGSWCSWTATTGDAWIHVSTSGTGSGVVTFTVDANAGAVRNGSIAVGGQTFAVSQAAADCSYSLSPASSGTLSASGASGSFSVTSSSWCGWAATTGDAWIHTSSGGTGNGSATFSVDANSGAARNGSITVGGQTFAVSQAAAACSYSISPASSGLLPSVSGGGSFNVTAGSWCGWTATTSDTWLHVSSSGVGNGPVTFTVDANSGAARSGSISVGGQTFAVSQDAAGCSYSLSPTSSGTLASSAASGSFSVTSSSWCSWSSSTTSSWIHTSSSGTGNGTVTYTVDANSGAARNGSITVGGQTFAVSQASAPCSYSISPTSSGTLASSATSGSFSVTSLPGCGWTATTATGWIHTTSTGTGSGTVIYTVDVNNGSARTGTISVGGQTFTVSQAAGNCKTLALSTSQLSASGGSGTVSAQATQGPCKKGLTSNASWLTAALDDPASQTSTLTFTADANTGAARVGTITVDDQTFTLYQDGIGDSNGGGKKNGHDDDFTAVIDPSTGLPTAWVATATSNRRFIESLGSFDLTSSVTSGSSSATSLYLESRLFATLSSARFEISTDETKWTTLANVPASTDWIGLNIDLSAYAGQVVYIRAVFDAAAPTTGTTPDSWSIRNPILIRR